MISENKKTILLVEDEAILAIVTKKNLERKKYTVHTINTGENAVKAILDNAFPVDLILMDIDLGSGIDGTVAAEQILKHKDIPVVFLSSHTEPEVVEKTEKITSYGYVVKNSGDVVLDASIKMAFKLFEAKVKEQKKEEFLREAYQYNDQIIQSAQEGIIVYDLDLRYRVWNSFMENISGITADRMLGKHPLEVFPFLKDIGVMERLEKALRGESTGSIDFPYNVPESGKSGWTTDTSAPLRNTMGEIIGVIGMVSDITERKQAEDALRESERKNISWIENSPVCTKIVDLDFNLQFMSESGIRELQIEDIKEFYGKPYPFYFYPDSFKIPMRENLKKAKETGTTITQEAPVNDIVGNKLWYHSTIVPVMNNHGKPDYLLVVSLETTKRKQAEDELRISKDLLAETESIGKVGGWSFNIDTMEQKWTDEVYRIHEVEIEPNPGVEAGINYYTKESRPIIEKAVQRAIEHGENYDLELEIITAKGNRRAVHTIGKADIKNRRIYGFFQDITERKQTELELIKAKDKAENSEAILSRTSEMANVGGWEFDLVNGKHFWTLQTYRIHELDPSIEPGLESGLSFYAPEARPIIEAAVQAAAKDGTPYDLEVPFITAKGRHIWVRTKGVAIMKDGKAIKLVGAFQDITYRKLAEDNLRESEERWRLLVTSIPDFISILDIDDNFLFLNRYSEGFSEINVIGTSVYSFMPDESINVFRDKINDCKTTLKLQKFEHSAMGDHGILRQYDNFAVPIHEKNGSIHTMIVSRDITDRRRADEEIQKQLSEKEALLKEIHHRVKNNIANIEGILFIQADSASSPEIKSALQDTISRVQSMRVLYEKLLLSKDYHDVSMKTYAEDLIDSLVTVFTTDKKITVDKRISDFTIASKKSITIGIIINELLTNVFKYAFTDRNSGTVSISIDTTENTATLIIQDNGIGFDNRTETNKSPGFGLTIVNMLVEHIGGTYSIINDNGTKSTVQFPI